MAASDKPQVVRPGDKAQAIDTVVLHIEKQFGKGAIMRLGEASRRMGVEIIPTGSIGLDIALGVGGAPRSRIVEIFGYRSWSWRRTRDDRLGRTRCRGGRGQPG